jgi:hypothetical protein
VADLELLPQTLNLSFWRGDDIIVRLTFAESVDESQDPPVAVDPIPASGWTLAAQVRASYSSSTIKLTFDIDMTDAATGIVVLSIAADDSASLSDKKMVWDLQRLNGGITTTLVAGQFLLDGDVTRAP